MSDRPIILAPWQVRAVQEGRLTQIRVPVKLDNHDKWELQDFSQDPELMTHDEDGEEKLFTMKGLIATFEHNEYGEMYRNIRSPFQPNDVLAVKETWCHLNINANYAPPCYQGSFYYYKADNDGIEACGAFERWHSPATMPRAAARMFLSVGEVGVQRLSDATTEDAKAEGCTGVPCLSWHSSAQGCGECANTGYIQGYTPLRELVEHWNARYKRYPWTGGLWTFVGTVNCQIGKGDELNVR